MRTSTSGNKVRFLLDIEYFEELHACLSRAESIPEEHPDAEGVYVMIAMWAMSLDTKLPRVRYKHFHRGAETQCERTLQQALEAIGAHHDIFIILWDGAGVPNITGYKERQKAREVEKWANTVRTTKSIRVHVKREVYKSYDTTMFSSIGTSNHQKMVIFRFTKDHYYALIGGFNLGTEYQSAKDHGEDANAYWHDTAVGLDGPSARVVANEWVRRWNKDLSEDDKWENRTIEMSHKLLSIDDTTDFRCTHETLFANATVTIATTNTEQSTPQRDIQALMRDHIEGATEYIYIENYALTDPTLVSALCGKLRAGRSVRVAVLVNHPRSELFWAHQDWARLMFPVYVKLTSARGARITFSKTANNQKDLKAIESSGRCTIDTSTADFNGLSLETMIDSGEIRWFTPETGMPVSWRGYVDDIESVVPLGDPIMFGARTSYSYTSRREKTTFRRWPYPHSKLALFDDATAVVGSANWTVRSMEYDGEIAAFISGGNNARDIATTLLSHWWPRERVVTLADWVKLAKAAAGEKVSDGEMVIEPLEAAHFARTGDLGFWKTKQIDVMYRWY